MAGFLSKHTKLSYTKNEVEKVLTNLYSVPELGGDPEDIDITTLDSDVMESMAGLKSLPALTFSFLYEENGAQYMELYNLGDEIVEWKVKLRDGMTFTWTGSCSVKLTGAEVNGRLEYALNIKANSDIVPAIGA